MARTKFDFLPADAKPNALRGVRDIEKRLVQIGSVRVCEARPSVASFFKATLKLCEEPKVISQMPVRMEKIALQDVAVGCRGIAAEARILVVLVFVSYLSPNGEIPSTSAQRDVLDTVDRFFLAIVIAEQAPLLVIAKRSKNRSLVLTLRCRRGRKRKQQCNEEYVSDREQIVVLPSGSYGPSLIHRQ